MWYLVVLILRVAGTLDFYVVLQAPRFHPKMRPFGVSLLRHVAPLHILTTPLAAKTSCLQRGVFTACSSRCLSLSPAHSSCPQTRSASSAFSDDQLQGLRAPEQRLLNKLFEGLVGGQRASLAESITLVESQHPRKKELAQVLLQRVLAYRKKQESQSGGKPVAFRVGMWSGFESGGGGFIYYHPQLGLNPSRNLPYPFKVNVCVGMCISKLWPRVVIILLFFVLFCFFVNTQVCQAPRVRGSHPSSRWWGRC